MCAGYGPLSALVIFKAGLFLGFPQRPQQPTTTTTHHSTTAHNTQQHHTNNNKNTIWRGSVLTGEELPPHSGELSHALTQVGGPTQSQLSRPKSSRHHISMEHRQRRKHQELNSDTGASNEINLKIFDDFRFRPRILRTGPGAVHIAQTGRQLDRELQNSKRSSQTDTSHSGATSHRRWAEPSPESTHPQ